MNIQDALNFENFYQNNYNEKMQVLTAYKLMKIHENLKKDVDFYKIELNKIIEEYGVYDDENKHIIKDGQVLMDSSLTEEWQNKIEELSNLEIEKPNITFKIEELRSLRFSFKEIELLNIFIDE